MKEITSEIKTQLLEFNLEAIYWGRAFDLRVSGQCLRRIFMNKKTNFQLP
jgi:hypothetical protein